MAWDTNSLFTQTFCGRVRGNRGRYCSQGWLQGPCASSCRGTHADILAEPGRRLHLVEVQAVSERRRDHLIPLLGQVTSRSKIVAERCPSPNVLMAVVSSSRVPVSLAEEAIQSALQHAPGIGAGVTGAGRASHADFQCVLVSSLLGSHGLRGSQTTTSRLKGLVRFRCPNAVSHAGHRDDYIVADHQVHIQTIYNTFVGGMTQATLGAAPGLLVHKELLAATVIDGSSVPVHHPNDLIRHPTLLATPSGVLREHQLARPDLDMSEHDPAPQMDARARPARGIPSIVVSPSIFRYPDYNV